MAHKCRKDSKFGVFLRKSLGFRVYEHKVNPVDGNEDKTTRRKRNPNVLI